MLSDFLKKLFVLYRVQQDDLSYRELIEFFNGETPPEDHNFLRYNYAPHIDRLIKYQSNEPTRPTFSVIIPTYNRRELLTKTVRAAVNQKNISLSEFEVIIIDNGSEDGTAGAVKNFADSQAAPAVIYVRLKKNCGADFARNVGVLNSRGRLLAFTDDDCIVPNDWLYEFKKELENNPDVAGVGGFKTPKSTKKHLDVCHRFLMWGHFLQSHIRTKDASSLNRCGLTANVCYRREIFEKLGGFNLYFQHIGFQEFKTRAHKSGLKLLYEPRMVEHFAYFTLRAHILKLFPQGWDRYLLYKIHPDIWPNPSFRYFCKRTAGDIRNIFTTKEKKQFLKRSPLDMISFSFLSVITNFSLWFGKYWIAFNVVIPASDEAARRAFLRKRREALMR